MQVLERKLRNKLEHTVMEARDTAEAAARAAVEQLGVGEPKPYGYLNDKERELRRKLRIHGRQLGDSLHAQNQTQEIDRLVEEIAYEHWHRMLFARFLAENNLLMYPDPDEPIAVSLEECEDLAAEEWQPVLQPACCRRYSVPIRPYFSLSCRRSISKN